MTSKYNGYLLSATDVLLDADGGEVHIGYDGALRPEIIRFLAEHSLTAGAAGCRVLDEHELAIG